MKTVKAFFRYTMHKANGGYVVAQLVEALCYNPKVAGSIPNGVIGIFH